MMIFQKKFEYFSKIQNWLTLRGVVLRTGYHCTESTILFSEDPKVTNTAESDSAQTSTARSRTLHSVSLRGFLPGTILCVQASPCL